jgi:co-chaperonin GroES (HSP10)
MKKTFRPLGDRVLLKLDAVKSVTDGGIIIPEVSRLHDEQGDTVRGEVLAVGPGKDIARRERAVERIEGFGDCTPNDREELQSFEAYLGRALSVDVKPGDAVLIQATVNLKDEEIEIDGETFHVVRAGRCMAVVEP